jgi:hypothetical protein
MPAFNVLRSRAFLLAGLPDLEFSSNHKAIGLWGATIFIEALEVKSKEPLLDGQLSPENSFPTVKLAVFFL